MPKCNLRHAEDQKGECRCSCALNSGVFNFVKLLCVTRVSGCDLSWTLVCVSWLCWALLGLAKPQMSLVSLRKQDSGLCCTTCRQAPRQACIPLATPSTCRWGNSTTTARIPTTGWVCTWWERCPWSQHHPLAPAPQACKPALPVPCVPLSPARLLCLQIRRERSEPAGTCSASGRSERLSALPRLLPCLCAPQTLPPGAPDGSMSNYTPHLPVLAIHWTF